VIKLNLTIQNTSKYSIFDTVTGNRLIDRGHLANLIAAVRANNLLQYQPILVNENMQIIDGQHRLEAAKRLQVEVFYIIGKGLKLSDVITLNSRSKMWTTEDYLQSHVKNGNKEYEKIHPFANEHGLSIANAIAILFAGRTQTVVMHGKVFREGKFEVTDMEASEEFVARLKELSRYTIGNVWQNRMFIQAMHLFYYRFELSHETLIAKLELTGTTFGKQVTREEYLKAIETVYNFNAKKSRVRLY
jgi:hypothetical protein